MNANVLIVDDEKDICNLLADTLQAYSEDIDVKTAFSGAEALEILNKEVFDILLTDICMPGMSGLELMKRAIEVQEDLQIIVVTAFADLENAIEALRTGAVNYLTKPVSGEVVYYAVLNAWQKKQAIDERKKAEISLRKALAGAEAANRAKSAFLANMSHELRTPLNGILGFVQILQDTEGLSRDQMELTASIYRSGNHMLTLVNDLLDITRIEANKLELRPAEIIFPKFLKTIFDIISVSVQKKNISLQFETSPDLPSVIIGDATRIRQVLINLLSNAVKFTYQGGIVFRVMRSKETPPLSRKKGDVKILFEVEDSGVGIPEEKVDDIFLPFSQLHDYQTGNEGAGLGLSISKRLVELMGGRLTVESKPNSGSKFRFELTFTEYKAMLSAANRVAEDGGDFQKNADIPEIAGSSTYPSGYASIKPPVMNTPPVETLNRILETAAAGNVRKCRTQAEDLIKADQTYKTFSDHIINLTKQFDLDRIESFISDLISETA